MHPSSLAARNIEARRRIKVAAATLGEALGVPPLETPNPAEVRQPAVAQMRELECLADLLESITAVLTEGKPHA
jgi:hypothetical protein